MEQKITLKQIRKYATLDLTTAESSLKMMSETLNEKGALTFWRSWGKDFYYSTLIVSHYRNIARALTESEEESQQNLLALREELEAAWRAGIGQESTTTIEQLNREQESEAAADALAKVNNLIFYLKK